MYSLRNILTQAPEKVSSAVLAVVNVAVVAGWVDVTKETLGGLNVALVLALGLFYVAPLTTSKAGLAQMQRATDDAHAAGVTLGASVAPPAPAKRSVRKQAPAKRQ